jgi:uncharacterized SAM-binding protein YcdF (DUF218 family)
MRKRTLLAVLSGVLLVYGGKYFINNTTLADRAVAPLLRADTSGRADLIVVPGAGVVGDCVANMNGVRRVAHAVRAYRAGLAPAMLIAGGSGDKGCPIAVAMSHFAEDMAVPAERIYIEPSSRSTRENAERSLPLLDALGVRRVLIVTDRLHMPRAEAVFAHYGFAVERASVPIYEVHADNVDMLQAGLREYAALALYRLRGWLAPADGPRAETQGGAGAENHTPIAPAHPAGPIVLLGASYVAGWTPDALAGRAVVNRGVGGEETTDMLARFDADVLGAAPRAVVLWGFINDIFRAQGDMEPVLAGIRERYLRMIAMARAAGIEPILATEATIRPRSESFRDVLGEWVGWIRGKASYQDQINRHVIAVNQWVRETAAREGLLLLDFEAVLAEPGGRRHQPFAQPDGSHITSAGYDALTAYAVPVFEEHFRGR